MEYNGGDTMARAKKDYHPFSIRMETDTYERLQEYCRISGQPKTVAIERAINMFIDYYELNTGTSVFNKKTSVEQNQ